MSKSRKRLLLMVGPLALGLVVACSWMLVAQRNAPGVTMAIFEKIRLGMTEEEVPHSDHHGRLDW